MLKKVKYILDNLRQEDKEELQNLWQKDWKTKVLNSVKNTEVIFAYGNDEFNDVVPIAMGGFFKIPDEKYRISCVWLLSTKWVKLNKIAFIKVLKEKIKQAEEKFDIFYNYIYKSNFEAKKWLKILGFSFDNPKPKGLKVRKNFEFFYKVIDRKDK